MTPNDSVINIPGMGAVRSQTITQLPAMRFLHAPYTTMSDRWKSTTPSTKRRKTLRRDTVRDHSKGQHDQQQQSKSGVWDRILPVLGRLSEELEERAARRDREPVQLNISLHIEESSSSNSSSSSNNNNNGGSLSSTFEKFFPLPILVLVHSGVFSKLGSSGLGFHGKDGGPTISLPSLNLKTTSLVFAKALLVRRF
ncbi:hypothetical protein BGW42_005937 [Actinomortierella wolfii]|nr:hypothetical protein BGW42_005937 [Actinomortierella wolfii]